jgi:serine/threonine-protein kinase
MERRVAPAAAQHWRSILAGRGASDGDELGSAGTGARFEVRGTLGEGGMGVVRHGTQHSLRRDIAVKSIRVSDDDVAITRVLQEALITGMMEHPNVVPVYDVDVDERGVPVILLKRIEGTEWSELIGAPERVREEFEAPDPLDWHLRVFEQVCNAVEHAHSLGIVHLDIKPENIMIGAHGEVYLMDWGIALSLVDHGDGRLPLAADCSDMLGTPSYLAPEMLEADGARLDERSDVFLLGATLAEISTGRAPRAAESLMATLHLALTQDIDPGGETPAELAAAIRRACDRDPARRFESVAQLRRAVRDFVSHQDSARLAARTDARRERLLEQLSGDALLRSADAQRPEGERPIDDDYAACRFGYGLALERWPENPHAAAALRQVVTAMIERELADARPIAARGLLRDASNLDPELIARVERSVAAQAGDVEALERLRRDLDPRIGQRTRWFLSVFMGALWTAVPLIGWFRGPNAGIVTYPQFAATTAAFLVLGGALAIWARESMSKTRVNRAFWGTLMTMCGAQLVLVMAAWHMRMPYETLNAMVLFMWACVTILATILIERRSWPLIPVYFSAFFATVAWPAHAHGFLGLANLAFLITVAWMWRLPLRRQPDEIDARTM